MRETVLLLSTLVAAILLALFTVALPYGFELDIGAIALLATGGALAIWAILPEADDAGRNSGLR
jgi:hypothetical protein